ncbi:MAG: hypothetical protein JWQ03_3181, partial [Variovorax sp.]|nr:hypothetical protein [Variovorax sp.]
KMDLAMSTVHKRVQQFLEANPAPDISQWRDLQLEDIEIARGKLMETVNNAKNPDQMARMVDRLVKLQERQARLLGMDMPTQTEVTHVVQTSQEAELEGLFTAVDRRNAEILAAIERGETPAW